VKVADDNLRHLPSAFLVALGLFAVLNWGLGFFNPYEFDAFKYPYRGWAWWAINDLRKQPTLHNVALLGSSLMVSAISGCEANYRKEALDLSSYHKATYLDHKLRTKFGGSFNTYNLSLPGQVPSDAYMMLRAMVSSANRPDVVIYGIAPRDFMDCTLQNPADTEPFKYLVRLVDLGNVSNRYFRSPWTKLDYYLTKHVFLYGKGLDLQMRFKKNSAHALAAVVPAPREGTPFTFWDRVRMFPNYLPGEMYPREVVVQPVDENVAAESWMDNTQEYMDRYRKPDNYNFKIQVSFLKELIAYCHKERIELVLVNMPITLQNATLLKPGGYMGYLKHMYEIAFQMGVPFYDLSDFVAYKRSYFRDTVHMNGFGGKKFVDDLVEAVAKNPRTESAMVMAGRELERQQVLAQQTRPHTY
jgi:hypothetical protein